MKIFSKNIPLSVVTLGMGAVGLVAGFGAMASAQTVQPTPVVSASSTTTVDKPDVAGTVDAPEANDTPDTAAEVAAGHRGSHDGANDTDGNSAKEANESASSTDSGE
jgi:hypothetical protein